MTTDPNNPEVLTSVPSDIEAAAIVAALDARGIKASTTGGYTAGFRAEAPGHIKVIVRHADFDDAQRTLQEIKSQRCEVDWTNVDVGDPNGADD